MKSLDIVSSSSSSDISLSGKSIKCGEDIINNLTSNERPLYLSELLTRINRRNLSIPMLRVIKNGKLYQYLGNYGRDASRPTLPLVNTEDNSNIVNIFPELLLDNFNLDELYSNVLNMKAIDGKTFYNSSKVVVDFLTSTITVDYLSDKEYTNTVSLIDVQKKLTTPGISCMVDLSVKYTKKDEEVIYYKNLTFNAFTIGEEEDFDFISSLDNEVTVEYVGGIVRVIPETLDIEECIISNCILTYGM